MGNLKHCHRQFIEGYKTALKHAEEAICKNGKGYTAGNDIQIIAWAAEAVRQLKPENEQ